MDNCVIESNSIVAAGAVVTQNTTVGSGSIWAGVPARKVKDIDQSDFAGEIERISNNYVMYSSWFKDRLFTLKVLSITSYLFSKISLNTFGFALV
jgi:carbonic anhydrase/acetyltransferase-like protein (isoleucine patch superfamily)